MLLGPTASLPKEIDGQRICNKKPRFKGFTVPWALVIDEHANCWLRSHYKAYLYGYATYKSGSLQLRVEMRDDGWHVWLPRGIMRMPPEYNLLDQRHCALRDEADRQLLTPITEIHLCDLTDCADN